MVVGWVVGKALLWISSDKDDRRSFLGSSGNKANLFCDCFCFQEIFMAPKFGMGFLGG